MALAYEPSPSAGPLRQAEVILGLVEIRPLPTIGDGVEFVPVEHQFAIVMTQDCDLEQDFTLRFPLGAEPPAPEDVEQQANALNMILMCDAYDATDMESYFPAKLGTKGRSAVRKNQNERYHCLDEGAGDTDGGHPALMLDLRTPFAVPASIVYGEVESSTAKRAGIVPPIFMHDLMHRFYSYHARVALPPAVPGPLQLGPGDA